MIFAIVMLEFDVALLGTVKLGADFLLFAR
jgi:hypothetical protein